MELFAFVFHEMYGQASAPWSSGAGSHKNVPLSEWQVAQTANCLKQQTRDVFSVWKQAQV